MAAKDEELGHWEAVLLSFRKRQELEAPQPTFHQDRNIDNLSWREIVLLVSDENDGQIPMKQVTTLLRGKVSNPDHAASAAYSTVGRLVKQGKVAKVRPGLYKWANPSSLLEREPSATAADVSVKEEVNGQGTVRRDVR